MSGLIHICRASTVSLAALLAIVVSASAQQDCRGWTMTCASVELRAEGDHLILFVPNGGVDADGAEAMEVDEASEGEAENVTVVPQPVDAAPFDVPAGTTFMGSADDPGNISCDEDESHYRGSRGLDEDDERRCGQPVGALFLLAVPASIAFLAPGDGGDPTVERPLPQSGAPDEGDDDQAAGDGTGIGGDGVGAGSDDGGDGVGAGSDDGGSDGTGGGDGTNSAGTSGGSGGSGGGATGGSGSGGSGGAGGGDGYDDDGTGNDGGTGPGGEFGPYHPTAGDLPPISQVPEPVSTTLFSLGLAGYAGARLRRRRLEAAQGDDRAV